MKKNLQQGVTLIELVITVVVLAIIIAIAVPSYQRMLVNAHVKSLAQDFSSAVAEARLTAVTEKKTIVLTGSSGGCNSSVSWENGLLMKYENNNETIKRWPAENCVTNLLIPVDKLEFNLNGFVFWEAANKNELQIQVCDKRLDNAGRHLNLKRNGTISSVAVGSQEVCKPRSDND